MRRMLGFTLAEILVALALIALLAAVLLPTVAGQILKGDAGRVMQDLEAVRAGTDQFLADVRRYPGRYSHLSKAITTSLTDVNGNTYPAGLVAKWAGPYVTKDTLNGVVPTGFGANILDSLTTVTHTNGVPYLTVMVAPITQADFDRVDLQIDGASGSPATTGLMRWASDTMRFLATPVQ